MDGTKIETSITSLAEGDRRASVRADGHLEQWWSLRTVRSAPPALRCIATGTSAVLQAETINPGTMNTTALAAVIAMRTFAETLVTATFTTLRENLQVKTDATIMNIWVTVRIVWLERVVPSPGPALRGTADTALILLKKKSVTLA